MSEETVTISKKKYEKLLDNSLWLLALRDAGVDNWSGYDYAIDTYNELLEEEQNEKEREKKTS